MEATQRAGNKEVTLVRDCYAAFWLFDKHHFRITRRDPKETDVDAVREACSGSGVEGLGGREGSEQAIMTPLSILRDLNVRSARPARVNLGKINLSVRHTDKGEGKVVGILV